MWPGDLMSKSVFTKFLVVPVFVGALSACAPQIDVHGYVPIAAEVAAVTPGKDTRETVRVLLGEPTTTGAQGSDAWYYISSRVHRFAFFAPKEVERRIVIIIFANNGKVSAVEHLSLEDGMIIDLNRNVTVTDGRRLTFLEQLLGNIGNFSTESFFGG